MSKVVMAALAFGTVVGARSNIIHVDPDGVPEARELIIDEADAQMLEDRGLAKRTSKKVAGVNGIEIIGDDGPVVEAERVQDTAKIDAAAGDVPSGLDSRQSTNFPAAQGVHEGAGPVGDGLSADDADAAPPAAPKPPATPKPPAAPKPPKTT